MASSAECAAAVTPHTTVGIHDDLAAGKTSISHWTANDKAAGWIDEDLDLVVYHIGGKSWHNELVGDRFSDLCL